MNIFLGGKGINRSMAAAKASSIAVTRSGAVPSIPWREEGEKSLAD